MMRSNQKNYQSTSQEEQSIKTDAHSASLQTQLQQSVLYIESPKIDWTLNDGLYHRFLKWKLKCENIWDCELIILLETRQCKKLISWSGDDGLDLVVSWDLTDKNITLETLWSKFEEFFKPQANEVRARFDLLTNFRQGDKSVDEWCNTVDMSVGMGSMAYSVDIPRCWLDCVSVVQVIILTQQVEISVQCLCLL